MLMGSQGSQPSEREEEKGRSKGREREERGGEGRGLERREWKGTGLNCYYFPNCDCKTF